MNAKDTNVMYGEDIIVPFGLKTNQVYIENRITILKFLEYYRKLFYNNDNRLSHSEMWLVSFTSETFEELYKILGYVLDDKKRDKYIRKVIKMSKDNFILHEWEKEKLEELVEYERRRNALEEGREQKNIEVVTNMLKENVEINFISKITGLNKEEIMKIKESL